MLVTVGCVGCREWPTQGTCFLLTLDAHKMDSLQSVLPFPHSHQKRMINLNGHFYEKINARTLAKRKLEMKQDMKSIYAEHDSNDNVDGSQNDNPYDKKI